MPEPTQTQGLEPEPIEAYRCPVCKHGLEMPLEEARKHVDTPIDNPLPKGFVHKRNNFVWIIYDDESRGIAYDHGIKQNFNGYVIGIGGIRGNETTSSKELKDRLKHGWAYLLTEQDLARFEKENPKLKESLKLPNFIRTTPELEALLDEASQQ